MPSRRTLVALLCGVLHAAVLLGVATHLGYDVGPQQYGVFGAAWRYGGLVLLAALPAWLAHRYSIVTPILGVVFVTAYVLGMELTPPGPIFRDVAELERLAEPTGVTVVEHGLYVVRYMQHATVWLLGFLFLGLTETVARNTRTWLPAITERPEWASNMATQREAVTVALVGGIVHAVVMTWFAARLGLGGSGAPHWAIYAFGAGGMVVLAAVPLYLLLRHRLFAPVSALTLFILLDVHAGFTASVDDPHALYFGGWFFYLAIILIVALGEYALRYLSRRRRAASHE